MASKLTRQETMVVCRTCDGSGSGDGFGIAGAGGVCRDCRGTGEVTPEKRKRQDDAVSDTNASPPLSKDQITQAYIDAGFLPSPVELELYRRPEDPPRSSLEPPCIGGKFHGAVVTAADDDDFYDPSILGNVPNEHQYGYCEHCRCPFRWSVERQEWLFWPEGWSKRV